MSDYIDEAITQLLHEWTGGDEEAGHRLITAIYRELRRIAKNELAREYGDHTLQTTELIDEAYIRLFNQKKIEAKNRDHFFAICARLMRQILMEHMRKRRAKKRGGDERPLTLSLDHHAQKPEKDFESLNQALEALSEIDPRKVLLVDLRYFAGFSLEQAAGIMKISPSKAKNEWKIARTWLYRYLSKNSGKEKKDQESS